MAEEGAGKFASIPAENVPQDAHQDFEAASKKSESFKVAKGQVLDSASKDELKANLPIAIVVKKNLKKDVNQLYERYKSFKEENNDKEQVARFKEACNSMIRDAQQAHREIKEKVYTVYEKNSV